MSVSRKELMNKLKAFREKLGSREIRWQGKPLSAADQATTASAIVLQTALLVDLLDAECNIEGHDVVLAHPLRIWGSSSYRRAQSWGDFVSRQDVYEVAEFLADAIGLWRKMSHPSVSKTMRGVGDFQRLLPTHSKSLVSGFLSPVRSAVEEFFSSATPQSFFIVYQHLSFLSHLSLKDVSNADVLEAKYCEIEADLVVQQLPEDLVCRMRDVISGWLHDFSPTAENILPKHGPGTIAEVRGDRSLYAKYLHLSPDALLAYVLMKHMPESPSLWALDFLAEAHRGRIRPTGRQSSIKIVPKSMRDGRVISKEPATLQFAQQGVKVALESAIRRSPLNNHVDFTRQDCNRRLAREASGTRSHGTIDLSAASDRVSFTLVKKAFYGTTVYPFLVATRSNSTVLPSGKVIPVAKFAPMGSALCFPVQSIIFASVVALAMADAHALDGGLASTDWRVYGDDIIVPEEAYALTVKYLVSLGFVVNRAKSYHGDSRFRESCGMDAIDGVCVTPMRIGRKYAAGAITYQNPDSFARLCDMANEAHRRNYRCLRAYLLSVLRWEHKLDPLFSEDPRTGLYSETPTNFHVPRRYNWNLQRFEVLVSVVESFVTKHSDEPILGNHSTKTGRGPRLMEVQRQETSSEAAVLYAEWLRRSHLRRSNSLQPIHGEPRWWTYTELDDPFAPGHLIDVRIGRPRSILTRKWVCDPCQVDRSALIKVL